MADPDGAKEGSADPTAQTRSTAQQVVYWLRLVSLVVAVTVMGAWWIAAGIAVTASTTFIFMFATIGVWVTVYQLLILGIKQIVRGRIEQGRAGRG